MSSNTLKLSSTRYGKSKVRVFRVARKPDTAKPNDKPVHDVAEFIVDAHLEGEIDAGYTEADNSVFVATDSIKNTCYVISKTSPHALSPTLYALHLALHFVTTYSHIHKSFISLDQLRWSRISVKGEPHRHSFVRDGDEKRKVEIEVDETGGSEGATARISGGYKDLLVLKSSGSAFEGFIRDGFTTLTEVSDRVFSTAIDLSYTFIPPPTQLLPLSIDRLGELDAEFEFDKVAESAREITLEVFAEDESASVQATLYKAAQRFLEANARVASVTYRLPNRHYVPVDLAYAGLENMQPPEVAEVFCPVDAPSGYISATVTRG